MRISIHSRHFAESDIFAEQIEWLPAKDADFSLPIAGLYWMRWIFYRSLAYHMPIHFFSAHC